MQKEHHLLKNKHVLVMPVSIYITILKELCFRTCNKNEPISLKKPISQSWTLAKRCLKTLQNNFKKNMKHRAHPIQSFQAPSTNLPEAQNTSKHQIQSQHKKKTLRKNQKNKKDLYFPSVSFPKKTKKWWPSLVSRSPRHCRNSGCCWVRLRSQVQLWQTVDVGVFVGVFVGVLLVFCRCFCWCFVGVLLGFVGVLLGFVGVL